MQDPARICYGKLPQHLIDEYSISVTHIMELKRYTIEPLKKAMKNSLTKYNKTKDPASQNSVTFMHQLLAERPMAVHPSLVEQVDDKAQALIDFKE